MAYDLFQVVAAWQQVGVYGVLLPFLLIFAITFAILEKINIFGKKNINLIVALILGLLFLQNIYLVDRLQFILPKISFAALIFVFLLFLVGILTGTTHTTSGKWIWIAYLAAIIFLVWSFSPTEDYGAGALDPFLNFFQELPPWVPLLAVLIGIVYLMTKSDTPPPPAGRGAAPAPGHGGTPP